MVTTKSDPVQLILAQKTDALLIHQLKKSAFMPLYEKYHDTETTPALDPPEKVELQLAQEETDYWLIALEGKIVGCCEGGEKEGCACDFPSFYHPRGAEQARRFPGPDPVVHHVPGGIHLEACHHNGRREKLPFL